jgi:hypothetical protein
MLTRDQIIKAVDAKTEEVSVPEWSGTVLIRVLSGAERDRFEQEWNLGKGKGGIANFRARFAALVICDEKGARLFDDKDVGTLAVKSSIALERVCNAGFALNKLTADDVKQLVGESEGDRSSASGSGSPSTSD